MDSIAHLSHKLIAERARQQRQAPATDMAPPPYSSSEDDSDSDEEDCNEPSKPVKLILNAAHNIQGSNNLIPTSPTPLADATKFSTLLLHAVNQINAVNESNSGATGRNGRRRALKIDLTINCGITVVGDRNVIGHVGIKPKSPTAPLPGTVAAVSGAKREAEGAPDCDGLPATKRIASSERS